MARIRGGVKRPRQRLSGNKLKKACRRCGKRFDLPHAHDAAQWRTVFCGVNCRDNTSPGVEVVKR